MKSALWRHITETEGNHRSHEVKMMQAYAGYMLLGLLIMAPLILGGVAFLHRERRGKGNSGAKFG